MIVDLHTHTTASDGGLSPQELVARAQQCGVKLLAVTDHDTIDAYQIIDELAVNELQIIAGIELSCTWSGVNIHVLGLGIDTNSGRLKSELAAQRVARSERAVIIGERLAKLGFVGTYEGAAALAEGRAIGRPDFARYMVSAGYVDSMATAFDKYLGAGKAGDVKAMWPAIETVVEWITSSGGVAVLAHPLHYKLTNAKLRRMLVDFKEAGGEGLEVCNGRPSPQDLNYLKQLCQDYSFEASAGSDFHQPNNWSELGCRAEVVAPCQPVWARWAQSE
ncbi:5'-3' exoribonuclease [Zhongshania aliphaticivorans]|uniref:5'-3' exoribonuclease n=1 Tax=Zhongshania aliphaticivorans TaxID=1470434 RepID=A0A5S9P1B0_9GAMM|nr:PHP domain-containing protein [Zhongshania aliphaticivorans]CAA0089872.1 5'-3' exoribonuclease [Zhongshania aliphaticivorans]CAA0096967.1 5'-3' exoribonuclease [Zhongshania aliphaticivorans]